MNNKIFEEILDVEPEISFKKTNRLFKDHESSPNHTVVKEPKYCVIRTCFDVDDSDYTEYEKRKQEYFIKSYTNNKAIEKKLKDDLLNSFITKNLLSSKLELYRFLNMFAYDIDMAIKNLLNYIDILRKLKEQKLMQKLYDIKSNSMEKNNIEEIVFELGRDLQNRKIIGIDFSHTDIKMLSSRNIFEEIIFSLISYLNIFFDSRFPKSVNTEQIIMIINLDKLNQSGLPHNFSEIIKLFEYMYPSRIHKMFFKCDPVILTHIEESLTEYNLEKITIINLENILNKKKIHSQGVDINIIIDFIKNPIKFKFNRIMLSTPHSNSTRVKSTAPGTCLKSNEVDTSNLFKFNGYEEYVDYKANDCNDEFAFERNALNKNDFTIKGIMNSVEANESSYLLKQGNFYNELMVNCQQFNILSSIKDNFISEKQQNKNLSIDKNSFSLLSNIELIEDKALVRKKRSKLSFEYKEFNENCNLSQCIIL